MERSELLVRKYHHSGKRVGRDLNRVPIQVRNTICKDMQNFGSEQNHHRSIQSMMASTIRCTVFPSQNFGFLSSSEACFCNASSTEICNVDKSMRRLVPCVIVIGRSVFSRSVKQGMPRDVVSS